MARPCTTAVQALLDDWNPLSEIAVCDLYTFTLGGGEVLRYSGWQTAISAPAPETDSPLINFSLGPPLKRTKTKVKIGIEVDQLDVEIYATDHEMVLSGGSITWQRGLHYGLFDGAILDLWRCFMSPPGTVIGTIKWFYGRVGGVEVGRTKSKMEVKSLLDLLTQQMPKRLFQAACTHVFGDTMCGFDRTTRQHDVTSIDGTTQTQVAFSGFIPDPLNLYDNGTLIGKTGANTGYKRTITTLTNGYLYFLEPWIFTVSIGDQFTLLPGCDHKIDTCENVFDNLTRFGGFPDVPPPENAV